MTMSSLWCFLGVCLIGEVFFARNWAVSRGLGACFHEMSSDAPDHWPKMFVCS